MAYQYYDPESEPSAPGMPGSPVQFPEASSAPASGESFAQKIRRIAKENSWSEDFDRFSDAQIEGWQKFWDEGKQRFRSEHAPAGAGDWAYVEKPTESVVDPSTGDEYGPWGNQVGHNYGPGGMRSAGGGGGGMAGYGLNAGGGYSGGTGYGGAPLFSPEKFVPPTYESAMADPGYQFALKEGRNALQGSAAAKGLLRTTGTLKDLLGYSQDMAATQYGNAFNRAAQAYGLNYQGAKDAFAPLYGSWQTVYGGDLEKWLQKQNQIYGLVNAPAPTAPAY